MNKYNKPKTKNEFIDLFKTIAKDEFNYIVDVPVSINKKLSSSLGRYHYKIIDKVPVCTEYDFNIVLLNTNYQINDILNVIRHELCHWKTYMVYNTKVPAHGKEFIKIAEEHGVNVDKYKPRKKLKKDEYYEAKCCNCDRVVVKSKNINDLKKYMNRFGGTVCNCGGNGKRYVIDKTSKIIYNHGRINGFRTVDEETWNDCLLKYYKVELCKEDGNEVWTGNGVDKN